MTFKDYFSGHADIYGAYRPSYPPELFEYLALNASGRDLAWDCGTGTGQAAVDLASRFRHVIATDASAAQISHARIHANRDNIDYLVAPAERSPLADGSVDLVTVAQALHWIDLSRFYDEVRRVARPGAAVACWCYQLSTIDERIDVIVGHYYSEIIESYWPPERRLVESGYRTLPFPFKELTPPPFRMTENWNLAQLLGYLSSWSGTRRYLADREINPLDEISNLLSDAWGEPGTERLVYWPLSLRIGQV